MRKHTKKAILAIVTVAVIFAAAGVSAASRDRQLNVEQSLETMSRTYQMVAPQGSY